MGEVKMPLISQDISSFRGGISQQPDILRFPDQLEEQINGVSSDVEGLQKRPPTIHIKRLGDTVDSTKTAYHVINRDEKEQYILEMSNENLRVFDMKGNEKIVKFPKGKSYLQSLDPKKDFKAVTVADYTFILNTKKVAKMQTDTKPYDLGTTTLVYVKNVGYAKTFAIFKGEDTVNDFLVGVITPDGGEAKQAVSTTTAVVATKLEELFRTSTKPEFNTYTQLLDLVGGTESLRKARHDSLENTSDRNSFKTKIYGDSVISIKVPLGTNLTVKDGFGNQNMLICKGYVSNINKLPPVAPDGYKVLVRGEAKSEDDDYYLEWDSEKSVWAECLAPGTKYKIDELTMPWSLVREADGTFTFKPNKWSERKVGSEDSNPDPTFIDKTINDIFFYRNRLGFISDENVILSTVSDYFNFWYKSAASQNDSDPIDVAVSSNKVSILTHAVPFARELMLFSPENQFVLSSEGVMTPTSVKVDQMTSFDYAKDIRPLTIGQNIYFINNRVNYCSLMRYYTVQDVAEMKNADDITQHAPTYIPKGIVRLSGNTTSDTISMLSESNTDVVWIMKTAFSNGTPTQLALSKWEMGFKGVQVCLAEFVGADIYFLINSLSGLYLERTALTGNALDFKDEPSRLFMDRKVRVELTTSNATYDEYRNKTKVSLKDVYGVTPNKDVPYYVVCTKGELQVITDWDSEGYFTLNGNYIGEVVFIGRQYSFKATLSKIYIKQARQDGSVTSEDEGRLQVRYFWFNYGKSGFFTVKVKNYENSIKPFEYTYTSRILGTTDATLGDREYNSGKLKVPIQGENKSVSISVESNTPTPLNLISGGWEGFYQRRNQKK